MNRRRFFVAPLSLLPVGMVVSPQLHQVCLDLNVEKHVKVMAVSQVELKVEFDSKSFVNEVVEQLREEINKRDVVLINAGSRQAEILR